MKKELKKTLKSIIEDLSADEIDRIANNILKKRELNEEIKACCDLAKTNTPFKVGNKVFVYNILEYEGVREGVVWGIKRLTFGNLYSVKVPVDNGSMILNNLNKSDLFKTMLDVEAHEMAKVACYGKMSLHDMGTEKCRKCSFIKECQKCSFIKECSEICQPNYYTDINKTVNCPINEEYNKSYCKKFCLNFFECQKIVARENKQVDFELGQTVYVSKDNLIKEMMIYSKSLEITPDKITYGLIDIKYYQINFDRTNVRLGADSFKKYKYEAKDIFKSRLEAIKCLSPDCFGWFLNHTGCIICDSREECRKMKETKL